MKTSGGLFDFVRVEKEGEEIVVAFLSLSF